MWKEMTNITRQQCVEFGQVATLAALVCCLYFHDFRLVSVALVLLAITLLLPRLFYPLAVIWFALAKILGEINIRVLLTLVFVIVVLPVGLIRKWRGKDTLQLRRFKKGSASVMDIRNHVYTKEALKHTF